MNNSREAQQALAEPVAWLDEEINCAYTPRPGQDDHGAAGERGPWPADPGQPQRRRVVLCAARRRDCGGSMTRDDQRIHVVPLNDLREHTASTDCWCKPTEDEGWPDVWVHHSMDRREEYEEGRKKS